MTDGKTRRASLKKRTLLNGLYHYEEVGFGAPLLAA